MRTYIIALFLILNSFLFYGNNQIRAQEMLSFTAGLGSPEYHHIGFRTYIDQLQIGVSIGTNLNNKSDNSILYTADLLVHFGKLTMWSDKRPWYFRSGLNYYRTETKEAINSWTYLPFRIGREIWISKNISLGLDAGFLIKVDHKETRKIPKPPSRSSLFNFKLDFGLPDIHLPRLCGSMVLIFHI